jgi:hypothetical protein
VCGLRQESADLDAGEITVHDSRVVVGGQAQTKAGGKMENADKTIAIDRSTSTNPFTKAMKMAPGESSGGHFI